MAKINLKLEDQMEYCCLFCLHQGEYMHSITAGTIFLFSKLNWKKHNNFKKGILFYVLTIIGNDTSIKGASILTQNFEACKNK